MNKRVVITGLGPVSSIGIGRAQFASGLASGDNHFAKATQYDDTSLEGLMLAAIEDFSIQQYLPSKLRKTAKLMSRDVQLAVASSILAMTDALLPIDGDQNRDRWGCISGAGVMNVEYADVAPAYRDSIQSGTVSLQRWGESSIGLLPPLMMLKYLPNMLGSHISIIHQLKGISNTITCGEPSGHIAIGEAFNVIRRGCCDLVLCGGAESRVNPTDAIYEHTRGRSSKGQTVPAEGAGYVVLESLDSATARNAPIYAELTGFSVRQSIADEADGDAATLGLTRCINAALRTAKLSSTQIDTIIPGSVGVIAEDLIEYKSLCHVFGPAVFERVFNTRSLLGNCYAGNSLDVIAATLLLGEQLKPAPSTIAPPNQLIQNILSISSSPDGQRAALIVSRYIA